MGAVLMVLAAVACFAALDSTTKRVTMEVPLLMAVWFRYVVQAVITTTLAFYQRRSKLFFTAHPGLQVTRGLLMLTVTLAAFGSLKLMPVGEFTAIVMTTPMLVTLLAARMLGEFVSVFRVALVLGGFAGTLVIVRPGSAVSGWAVALPMAVVLANTAFQLLTSRLARTENAMTIQVYTSWVGTLLTTPLLYWCWAQVNDPHMWIGLIMLGVTGAVGHILLVMAFQRAPAATLMPYMYLQIGFAMLGGWLLFEHIPDQLALLGIGLIASCGCAGAILTILETRLRAVATR